MKKDFHFNFKITALQNYLIKWVLNVKTQKYEKIEANMHTHNKLVSHLCIFLTRNNKTM